MRRYWGISFWEYREYEQNGCIRAKDSIMSGKRRRHPEDEPIKFRLNEMLDSDGRREWDGFCGGLKLIHSFSFGDISIHNRGEYYQLELHDPDKVSSVVRRLKHHGVDPDVEGNLINVFKDEL